MDELQIQSLIVKSARADFNGCAHKTNNRFIGGIPDLFIATPATGPFFLEVKILGRFSVTELQKRMILDMQRCGVLVGVVVVDGSKGVYDILTTSSPNIVPAQMGAPLRKHIGRPWPIFDIFSKIKGELR